VDTSTLYFDYSFFIRVEDKSSLLGLRRLIILQRLLKPNSIFTSRYDTDRTKF